MSLTAFSLVQIPGYLHLSAGRQEPLGVLLGKVQKEDGLRSDFCGDALSQMHESKYFQCSENQQIIWA